MGGRGVSSPNVSTRKFDGKVTLQGMGQVSAYKVENLRKGDVLQWNYGYTSKVKSIKPTESGKSYNVTTISSTSGEEYTTTYRRGRLLAISSNEAKNEKEVRINALRSRVRNG